MICQTLHQNDLIHQGQDCMSGPAAITVSSAGSLERLQKATMRKPSPFILLWFLNRGRRSRAAGLALPIAMAIFSLALVQQLKGSFKHFIEAKMLETRKAMFLEEKGVGRCRGFKLHI